MFKNAYRLLLVCLCLAPGARAVDLSTAPAEELMKTYAQLRALHGGPQSAVAENVEFKRDSATFRFVSGRMALAAPVGGHVVAAYFEGSGSFQLQAPTPAMRNQLARFAGGPVLNDEFEKAVFFFTDDSATELQRLMNFRDGGDADFASAALAGAQKKFAQSFSPWWNNERQGNPVMRNVPARMLADLSDPSSKGFFLADFKTRHHGDLLFQISWNRDSLLFPYLANDEEVALIHYNRDEYYEWWAGFHLQGEYAHTAWPEHRTLLAHCGQEKIDAEITKDNRLSATATMDFEVPGGSARILPLSLEGVLRISSLQDGHGAKPAFIQEPREFDSDVWVILPEPATAGKKYQWKFAYAEGSTRDSRIVHQQGSGLFYVTARESWYPSFGAFDDRTHFNLHFISPKKYKFVATGRQVAAEKGKDGSESTWDSDVAFPVVGFNYGDFVVKSQGDANLGVSAYVGTEVPDELKAISADFTLADLAGDHNAAGEAGVAEGGFNTSKNAQYTAGISFQSLKLFEYLFGTLPFKTISVTEQPVTGYGQSWPTLIFLPYDSLLDSSTRHQLDLQTTKEDSEFYNLVAVHEMAHQWWGHMVGWKTYRDQWLSEGFAEFSASYFSRKFQTEKVRNYWDVKRKWLLSNNTQGHRPAEIGPLYLNEQLNTRLEPRNATEAIYDKGAYVLEMLRLQMEDRTLREPDQHFIDMMHDFVTTYANRNASTSDFQHMVEKHMGRSMDSFFNEYVYGTEIPTYNFQYTLQPTADGKSLLEMSLTQTGVSDDFEMRVPVYLTMGKRVVRLGLVPIKGSSTGKTKVTLATAPDHVSIDEYHDVLAVEHQ